ncbi:MAG: cob(I)yrinic acid a,c-diamide adenosyltransferase [Kiritimatiellia bacterium]
MNDDGSTSLPGGLRIGKSDPLVCALGALDELNAALGLLRAAIPGTPEAGRIESIQRDVGAVGGEWAAGSPRLDPEAIAGLERETARLDALLPPARGFVRPGANESSARAHWARAVCRRAEREGVRARDRYPDRVSAPTLAFLNRLSGLLFSLARFLETRA